MKALVMALALRQGRLGSLVGIGLLVSTALPAGAGEIAGRGTVAQWRQSYGRVELAAVAWSYGAISALTALGMECKAAVGVRELEPYMMYRAAHQTTVAEALRVFWRETGCELPPQTSQAEAKPDAWQEFVGALWKIRTTSSEAWLRKVIEEERVKEEAGAKDVSEIVTHARWLLVLVARDRLRELSEKQPGQ